MNRFPPTAGIVGHDFGYKPAFSLAVIPQGVPIRQQQTEEEDFRSCHDLLGDTLSGAISGILGCGGCYTVTPSPPLFVAFDYTSSFTGINGAFTANWDGTSQWIATIGSTTVTSYTSTDGTCSGTPTTSTSNVFLFITCAGKNFWTAVIDADFVVASAPVGITFFGAFDIPSPVLPNDITICQVSGPQAIGGHSGFVTITVP